MSKNLKCIECLLFPPQKVNQKKLELAVRDKTILITGATYGIGEQLAYLLAFERTTLILVARTSSKLHLVKENVAQAGGNAEIYCADLRNEQQIEGFILYLKTRGEDIDVFVSNAGKSIKRSVYDSLNRFHDYERTMSINYFAPVRLCLALIPLLERKKGHILNISAVNVLFFPMPEWAAYQASKTAFDQWFRSVSFEINAKQIATSSIYFPLVRTRMIAPTKMYRDAPAMLPRQAAQIIARCILSRKTRYKPWWLFLVEFICLFFHKTIYYVVSQLHKRGLLYII